MLQLISQGTHAELVSCPWVTADSRGEHRESGNHPLRAGRYGHCGHEPGVLCKRLSPDLGKVAPGNPGVPVLLVWSPPCVSSKSTWPLAWRRVRSANGLVYLLGYTGSV